MKRLRQVLSLALVVAFGCFSVRSIDLHVHATAEHDDHHHGAALHHHAVSIRLPLDERRIAALDAADTRIPVRLSAASTSDLKPAAARRIEIATVAQPEPAMVSLAPVVARAHGPPSHSPRSLRGPPRPLSA